VPATLIAGIDSSTQSCKVVIRDAVTGALVREGRAAHPPGTEVDPKAWWTALEQAAAEAGGLDDVAAVAVAAQQHGCVCLDEAGSVVRPALLWNDTRSAAAADELIVELGQGDPDAGRRAWAEAVGSVPVASFTVTKLRWIADHEPDNANRTAAVCLPHDWLTWRLAEGCAPSLDRLITRSRRRQRHRILVPRRCRVSPRASPTRIRASRGHAARARTHRASRRDRYRRSARPRQR
jgi:xylulokinase